MTFLVLTHYCLSIILTTNNFSERENHMTYSYILNSMPETTMPVNNNDQGLNSVMVDEDISKYIG